MSIQTGDLVRPTGHIMVGVLARRYGLSASEIEHTTFRAVFADAASSRIDVAPITQQSKVYTHRNYKMFERI